MFISYSTDMISKGRYKTLAEGNINSDMVSLFYVLSMSH